MRPIYENNFKIGPSLKVRLILEVPYSAENTVDTFFLGGTQGRQNLKCMWRCTCGTYTKNNDENKPFLIAMKCFKVSHVSARGKLHQKKESSDNLFWRPFTQAARGSNNRLCSLMTRKSRVWCQTKLSGPPLMNKCVYASFLI